MANVDGDASAVCGVLHLSPLPKSFHASAMCVECWCMEDTCLVEVGDILHTYYFGDCVVIGLNVERAKTKSGVPARVVYLNSRGMGLCLSERFCERLVREGRVNGAAGSW